jgi:hypothetical protein
MRESEKKSKSTSELKREKRWGCGGGYQKIRAGGINGEF